MKSRVVFFSCIVAVAAIAGMILFRFPTVLWRWKEPGSVDPGDGLVVILNPVRDRSPERAAERVLRELRLGSCDHALSFIDAERRTAVCRSESSYRPISWNLRDREESGDRVTLHYSVYRAPLPALPSNTWITVRFKDGVWQAEEFECWY
jgi:hypothetical protein